MMNFKRFPPAHGSFDRSSAAAAAFVAFAGEPGPHFGSGSDSHGRVANIGLCNGWIKDNKSTGLEHKLKVGQVITVCVKSRII